MEVYLLEATPYDPGTAGTVNLRLSSGSKTNLFNGNKYSPRLSVSLDYQAEVFSGNTPGASTAANGNVIIANPDGEFDYLLDYTWDGRDIEIKWAESEDTAYGSFLTVFKGSTKGITVGESDIVLVLRDNSERLAQEIQPNQYLGTGAEEGDIDNKNKPKPLLYGKCFNFEPILLDSAKLIYQLNDGVLTSVNGVFDRGVELTAGSDYATHALLDAEDAANIAAGTYATCLAEGFIRLGALPSGLLTVDADGFPVYTIADIVEDILLDPLRGGLVAGDLDAASFTAFEASSNWESGYYLKESDSSVNTVIEELVSSVFGYWYYDFSGKLNIKRFSFNTVVDTIEPKDIQVIKRLESIEPNWSVDVDYKKVWRVHGRDEIAFADLAAEVPVAVFKRSKAQPTTPTGDGTPSGWSATYPGYEYPTTVGSLHTWGPVWVSTATQIDGVTQGSWDTPRKDDSSYAGWTIEAYGGSGKAQAATDSIKVDSDFVRATDTWPSYFIDKSITGASYLACVVSGSTDSVYFGLQFYEPTSISATNDIKEGFFTETSAQETYFFSTSVTGSSFTSNYTESDSPEQRLKDTLGTDTLYEIVYNGETFDFYINGELLITQFVDNTWEGTTTHWPIFILTSPDAEIKDIVWRRGTTANQFNGVYQYSEGNTLMDVTTNTLNISSVGPFDAAYLYTNRYPALYIEGTIVESSKAFTDRSFIFVDWTGAHPNGASFDILEGNVLEIYTNGLKDTITWAAGDVLGIDVDSGRIVFYKNGSAVWTQGITNTGVLGGFELRSISSFSNVTVRPKGSVEANFKGSVSLSTLVTPFTDASPTVTGGYVELGVSEGLLYTTEGTGLDTLIANAAMTYLNDAGSAVSFNPDIQVQWTQNDGSTWNAAAETYTPSTPTTVAPGASASVTVSATLTGTPTSGNLIKVRLLVKNQIAGVYSVSLTNAYLTLKWTGY